MPLFSRAKTSEQQNKEQNQEEKRVKKSKKEERRESQRKQRIEAQQKKSVQNLLSFNKVYDDGTIELDEVAGQKNKKDKKAMKRYARIVHFSDINYQLASQDEQIEIFAKYSEFITFFDPAILVQILILNQEVNKQDVLKTVFMQKRGDANDRYRNDYNDVLLNSLFSQKVTFQREKYIVFSFPAETYEIAKAQLDRVTNDVLGHLANLNSHATLLDNDVAVLNLFHKILRPHEEFILNKHDIMFNQKDVISPMGIHFANTRMEIYAGDVDPVEVSTLLMRDYPATIMDKMISELSMQQFDTITNIYFHSIEQAEAIKMVQKKLTAMNTEVYSIQKKNPGIGESVIPYALKQSIEESSKLLDDLHSKGQRLFLVTILITVFGKDVEDLKNNIAELKGIARKNGANLDVLSFYPAESLNSTLPMGKNFLPIENVERLLNTSGTAILIPFTSMDILEANGIYYGINSITQVPIIFNRAESLRNPNGFILGTPGSGKSFLAKKEIISVVLNRNDDVLVIDPEREYKALCDALGGSDIIVSAATNTFINPLDMTEGYEGGEGDPLELKAEFVLSLIRTMFGGELSPAKKSIIDRVLRVTYQKKEVERRKASGKIEDYFPTLIDFYNELKVNLRSIPATSPEYREINDILLAIELYTTGSFNMFAQKTNIETNNRFIVYDIKDLGKEIKTLGMLVVLDQIWNRIAQNREENKRTWLYIDEIYLLFANEYSAEYLYQLFKRARKWGGIITGITQNVEDMLQSDMARTMLANSDFLVLFNQSPTDRATLKDTLKLSDQELRHISSSPPGQGIIGIDHRWIPFYDRFPQVSEIYKLITTKVGE